MDDAEEAFELAEEFDLDVDERREPKDGWLGSNTWVQNYDNQRALLDAFFSAVDPEKSLCFFYAKQTPLSTMRTGCSSASAAFSTRAARRLRGTQRPASRLVRLGPGC